MARAKGGGTPLFYRLLRSYSLISVLPIASAWIVLAIWGDTLVAGYLRTEQEEALHRAVRETEELLTRYTGIAARLADNQHVRRAVAADQIPEDLHVDALIGGASGPDSVADATFELELYRTIFAAIADDLESVDVHVTDDRSRRVYSSTVFPDRYRLHDFRNRRDFAVHEESPGPRLFLNPRDEEEASRVVFSIWTPVPKGFVVIDVGTGTLWNALSASSSMEMYLVDRQEFRVYHLAQSGRAASFAQNPELGIAFSDEHFQRPRRDLMVGRSDLQKYPLSIVATTQLTTYFATIDAIQQVGGIVVIGLAIVVLLVSIRVSRSISRPIHEIVHAISADRSGPQPLPETTYRQRSGELRQLMIHYDRMVATLRQLIDTVREEEKTQRIAERRALESQIQPHFLYNTLGSIKSMAKLGDTQAVTTMVTDLGKMLRFLLSDTETMVPLEVSMEQIRRYLNIQKVRFQERMRFTLDLAPLSRNVAVPKLLVQPLVENAVLHGVEVSTDVVDIRISTVVENGTLVIQVEDTGHGSDDVLSAGLKKEGIGLQNVRERLNLFYGDAATLTLRRTGGVTTAAIGIVL